MIDKPRFRKFDLVDAFAFALLAFGVGLMVWGIGLDPPGSINELVLGHFGDWTSGLIIDGVLLLVINQVIHSHERRRVISQVASLSNEFALDAVRRCREEGWLHDGTMESGRFAKARLATADLSEARLSGADLTFADLTGSDLTHSDLRGCDFRGANLSECDLRWSDLSNSDLSWADLRSAQLDGARLEGAITKLTSVDPEHLQVADLEGVVVGGFLTARQVDLVKAGFSELLSGGDAPMVRFYQRLFERAPELKDLFSQDIERQARKFVQSLRVIVGGLSSTEKAAPVLQRLGQRHQGYGVQSDHYAIVGRALIDTIEAELGDGFTDEMRESWVAAFDLVASLMQAENPVLQDSGTSGAVRPA